MAAATTVGADAATDAAAADDAVQGAGGAAAEELELGVDGYGSGDDGDHHRGLLLGDADRSNCTPQTTESSARARLRPHKPLPLAVLIGAAAFGLSMDQVSIHHPSTRLLPSTFVYHPRELTPPQHQHHRVLRT